MVWHMRSGVLCCDKATHYAHYAIGDAPQSALDDIRPEIPDIVQDLPDH